MSRVYDIEPAPTWAHGARILSAVYDDVPWLERAAGEFGASVLLLYCAPETTNGWCPVGTWDQVAHFIAQARGVGLHVVCYYDTTWTEACFHPSGPDDTCQRTPGGEPQTYRPPHVWQLRYAHCFNTAWSARVAAIAARYVTVGADGVFLDNPNYYTWRGPGCFCETCRSRFAQETGLDLDTAAEETRIAWHQDSLCRHVERVYRSMRAAAPDGRGLVITCNTANPKLPMQRLDSLGRAENVVFRETFPGHPDPRHALRQDAAVWPDKPLWVILTEGGGSQAWRRDVSLAVAQFDTMLEHILAVQACPMVWSSIPSQDPNRPGFALTSIYSHPALGEVVARRFAAARAATASP